MKVSITTKITAVILTTICITAVGAYWSAEAVIQQLSQLTQDEATDTALVAGRNGLLQLHKLRRHIAVDGLKQCVVSADLPICTIGEYETTIKLARHAGVKELKTRWLGETEVEFRAGGRNWTATIPWPELRPDFESVSEILKTRAHLKNLSPQISKSFLTVFSGVMGLACIVGLLAAWLLSGSIKRRVRSLTSYANRLATGKLEVAPGETKGEDEVGILAASMEAMANDLNTVREKLVYAEKINSWQAVARKVAHEIKNPLTPISLVADHVERFSQRGTNPYNQDLAESARILREEIGALNRMVEEFSSFARLPKPELRAANLNGLLADFIARNSSPNVVWNFERSQEESLVAADRRMLFQVFHNLTNNARLACDPEPVRVTLRVHAKSPWMHVEFQDNGPGVPEKIKHSLFDAYVTTRSTGEKERGMGLGLAISRKIAEDHGGSLNLKSSSPEEGTVFLLALPILRDPS